MKIRVRECALLAGLLLLILPLCAFTKAATYTGEEWAVNFWGTEMNTLDEDFERIRGDGFNSVVIAVPWRQFQPDARKRKRNEDAYRKLGRILEAAGRAELRVLLRVSYTWDSYPGGGDLRERFRELRCDPELRAAWLDYVKSIYEAAAAHPAFAGGFLTWEDFWDFVTESGSWGEGKKSVAKRSGYEAWVRARCDGETLSRLYGRRIGEDEPLWFPGAASPALRLVYEWNDEWMNALLAEAQAVFPGLSMEVRLDLDPVLLPEGGAEGYSHAGTFSAGGAPYTACMYSAAMGYEPGSVLTAEMGIQRAAEILGALRRRAGGKPVFIDQFLYSDNTPEFRHNARLSPEEIPAYIAGMAPVIRAAGGGYAVWAYRDYADNVIYNGQFGQGRSCWKLSGKGARICEAEGNASLVLPAGARAEQKLPDKGTGEGMNRIEFSYRTSAPASLRVTAGSYAENLSLSGEGVCTLETGQAYSPFLAFSSLHGEIELDNIKLYAFVTEGGIYRRDGSEGPWLSAIRELNRALPD